MLDMYKGMANSPETTITNNISNSDTLIYVLDPTRVPSELPNLMTLGTTSAAETIKVISVDGNALTVERGFQGTPAAWNAGTVIARNFTEYDYNALRQNVTELEEDIGDEAAARAAADDLKVNISDIIDGLGSTDPAKPLSAKQGKALSDLISTHRGKNPFDDHAVNPMCRVYKTADQSVATTTVTTVAFDAEIFDTDSIHDNSANNSRLTCKTAGKYLVSLCLAYQNGTGYKLALLYKNGAQIAWRGATNTDAGNFTSVTLSTILDLSVNDYIEAIAYHNHASAVNVKSGAAYTDFSMVKVG